MNVAFISGTSIAKSSLFDDWSIEAVETPYGQVTVKRRGSATLINRHGFEQPMPPHSINYRANLRALKDLGADAVISLNSVGSLRPELTPGTFVSCSDYVSFAPATFHDFEISGQAPRVGNSLIPQIVARFDEPIVPDQVYVQTRGPRFETRAEVRIVRHWGDVAGMTMAYEADLAQELGIDYNSLCIIDNYAHGLMPEELSFERFKELVKANQDRVNRLFRLLLELFAS
jgi:5'-methylthioadenosine phosphorylase